MDYLFYHSIQQSWLKNFIISYDIACQWSVNLKERMFAFDHEFFLFNGATQVKFFVPKFHLPAHISACQSKYSFNFGKGVGQTEGEAPKRGWLDTNALALSTREMGLGSRRDTLDYHFGDHNRQKVTSISKYYRNQREWCITDCLTKGASLCRKLVSAATDMAEHTISHNELSSTFSEEILDLWTKQVKVWENDPTQLNSFEAIVQGMLDWPRSGSWTVWTWFKPEPELRFRVHVRAQAEPEPPLKVQVWPEPEPEPLIRQIT